MPLESYRKRIDAIDKEIVSLLNERYETVRKIGAYKKSSASAIYIPEREKLVYEKVRKLNAGPMRDVTLFAIYREIMSGALSLEQELSIAYFGPEGGGSHFAAVAKFGDSVTYISCATVGNLLESIASGKCDYGCVPVSALLDGGTKENLSYFAGEKVSICAEARGHNIASISMSTDAGNTSRFLILGRQKPVETGRDRTSLAFLLPDRPGTLCNALLPFRDENLTLHMLGGHPAGKEEEEDCYFFMDLEGHIHSEKVQECVKKLREVTLEVILLGSYPKGLKKIMVTEKSAD